MKYRVFALFFIGMCMMNVSLLHAQKQGDIDLRTEDSHESQTGGRSIDVAIKVGDKEIVKKFSLERFR